MTLKYTERKRYVEVVRKRRALHSGPPEDVVSEGSVNQAMVGWHGFGGCVKNRGTMVIIGYGKDQLVLTFSMTESGTLQEAENIR
jgi:hypothetical protein